MSAPASRRGSRGLRARWARHPLVRALPLLDLRARPVVLAVGAGSLALGSAVALVATSAWLIATASRQPAIVEVTLAVVAVRALGISRGVFRYLERLMSHDVALRGLVRLREQVYRSLAAADPRAVARLRRGDLLARLGTDVDALGDAVVRGLAPFAVAAVVGTASVAGVAAILPVAALPMAAGLLVAGAVAPSLAARAARRAVVGAADARAAVAVRTQALLDGLAELEVAGAVDRHRAGLDRAEDDLTRHLDTASRPHAVAAAVQALAVGATVVAALLLGAGPVTAGALDGVWLTVVVLVPLAAFEATAALPAAAVELVRGSLAAERVLELADLPPASPSEHDTTGATAQDGPAADPWGVVRGHRLAATGLSCGWAPDRPLVRGADLSLAPGECVVVTGPSGSGKSTLLTTLAGLLPPTEGTVRLDGRDLADLPAETVRRRVHLTTEDEHVFATSLRENLRVAAGPVEDEVLLRALDAVGLGPWVTGLPRGLGTAVGSGGHDLSGGQRRRLLLARALLTAAPVLLVDEGAEHLDAASGARLVADLAGLARRTGRIVVLVTHGSDGLDAAHTVLEVVDGRLRSASARPASPAAEPALCPGAPAPRPGHPAAPALP
ncbi:thiol reductant ABC exporter subunit CydC [Thalassiella azotivora]